MAQFAVGQSITTRESAIEVDAGLALGDHRFSLVVVGASGRRSAADVVSVRVQRLVVPIDRVTPIDGLTRRSTTKRPAKTAGPAKPAAKRAAKRKASDPE